MKQQTTLVEQEYYWRKGIYTEYYREECGLCGLHLKDKMCLVMVDDEYGECSDPIFCSLNCYILWTKRIEAEGKRGCLFCGNDVTLFHHTDYIKNEGISVCHRCHSKIHHGRMLYDAFKPINKRRYTPSYWRGV